MKHKFARMILAAGLVAGTTAPAYADAIVGMWQRPASEGGTLQRITQCGSSFCVTVASGEYSGQRAGKFDATGNGRYQGEITDLAAGKTYKGKALLKGNSLDMSGCVALVFCRTETWTQVR